MVFEEKDLRLYDGSSRKWNKKHVVPIVNACAAMARPLEEDGYFGLNSKDELCDRITALLRDKPKGLPCVKIASLLGVDKKAIRSILCDNTDRFSKNFIFWKLK